MAERPGFNARRDGNGAPGKLGRLRIEGLGEEHPVARIQEVSLRVGDIGWMIEKCSSLPGTQLANQQLSAYPSARIQREEEVPVVRQEIREAVRYVVVPCGWEGGRLRLASGSRHHVERPTEIRRE